MTNKSWSTFYFPFSFKQTNKRQFPSRALVFDEVPNTTANVVCYTHWHYSVVGDTVTNGIAGRPSSDVLAVCLPKKPVAWGVLSLVFPHLGQCYFFLLRFHLFSHFVKNFSSLFFFAWNPQRESSRDLASLVALSLQSLRSVRPTGRLRVSRAGYVPMCVFFYLVFNLGEKCWVFTVGAARQPHPAGPAHLAGKRREREDNLFDQQTPRLCLLISFLKIFFIFFFILFCFCTFYRRDFDWGFGDFTQQARRYLTIF